jgi:hypothetical protein
MKIKADFWLFHINIFKIEYYLSFISQKKYIFVI